MKTSAIYQSSETLRGVDSARRRTEEFLAIADVHVDGDQPWDMQVHNSAVFSRVLRHGSLGLGEAYMDGWWDAGRLDEFFTRILEAHLSRHVRMNPWFILAILKSRIWNLQSLSRAFQVGESHYDIGNDLYRSMLDTRMTYSCGYWKYATTLDEAQEQKLDLICRKIGLREGQRVLDIGCGWGSFAGFAAEKYGANVVGVTISKEQVDFVQNKYKRFPVEIRLQDYRELDEPFDHIVSVGMFEHVGYKNYRTYMDVVHRCLKKGGLFLLHTIGSNTSNALADPWMERYIFPNGMLPSLSHISSASEGKFVMEDVHNFGADYDTTLMNWFANFDKEWKNLRHAYDQRFYRMWKYYLHSCAGLFRSRNAQLWQIVFSKNGVPGGYSSVR